MLRDLDHVAQVIKLHREALMFRYVSNIEVMPKDAREVDEALRVAMVAVDVCRQLGDLFSALARAVWGQSEPRRGPT